jgi:hypothetical protein
MFSPLHDNPLQKWYAAVRDTLFMLDFLFVNTDELRIAVSEAVCGSEKERRTYEEALIAITVEESLKQ